MPPPMIAAMRAVVLAIALLAGVFTPFGSAAAFDCKMVKAMCLERCSGKSTDSRLLSLSGSARFECEEACKGAVYWCNQGDQRSSCKEFCKGSCANDDRAEWGRCENRCVEKCYD